MIDTGCKLNLIKENAIEPSIEVNTNKTFHLVGIGKGMIKTFGEVILKIENIEIKFQIVDDAFPIEAAGILGVSFLTQQEATIKFRNKLPSSIFIGDNEIKFEEMCEIDLPPRSKKMIKLRVKNNLKSGYLERINAGTGVYLGEALVSQTDGFVKVYAINSTADNVNLTIPPVKLQEFEFLKSSKNEYKQKYNSDFDKISADRVAKLTKLINMDHLNEEEKASLIGAHVYDNSSVQNAAKNSDSRECFSVPMYHGPLKNLSCALRLQPQVFTKTLSQTKLAATRLYIDDLL
ncbi:hypothetical protein QAD02_002659 [Eretmocerus hayati]|uniref:Uncharacterized protein n=1 Tax=Eretmocerus hayati TaxID=131215 RepID=A0ACC2NPE6_9HYME|nr:hypothetical protein QAD02_002659 [Eretmocerus hayati]